MLESVTPGQRITLPLPEWQPIVIVGRVEVRDIIAAAAIVNGISVSQMLSRRRARKFSWPRQQAMFLAAELTRCSLPEIARALKLGDHTTVIHGIRQVERRMADPTDHTREMVAAVRARVGG